MSLLGLTEVLARLDEAVHAMEHQAAGKTVATLAEHAAEEMRAKAPVLTGELRDGITVEGEGHERTIIVGSDHAIPVEFGGEHGDAQPFFRPAMHKAEAEFEKVAEETYRREVPGME